MFCSNCGKELEEGSKFCRFCGTLVPQVPVTQVTVQSQPAAATPERSVQSVPENGSVQQAPVQAVQPERQEAKPDKKKKGTGKKILKWFFILLLVAVVGLFFVGALLNGNFDGMLKLHRREGFWTGAYTNGYVPNKDYVWLELNKDGTGTLNLGWGDVRSVKWYDGFQSGHFDIEGKKTEFGFGSSGIDGSSFYLNIDGNEVHFAKFEKAVPFDDVSFVKAEVIEDVNGMPALRVYYNWTNKTDHPQAPVCSSGHPWYIMHLGQPGGFKEHADVPVEALVPEDYENYLKEAAPGETVCLSQVMKYNPREDAVVILYRFEACTLICDVKLLKEEVLSGWDDRQGVQLTARIARDTLEITESVENRGLDQPFLE